MHESNVVNEAAIVEDTIVALIEMKRLNFPKVMQKVKFYVDICKIFEQVLISVFCCL